jgi:hypothetical protein
MDKKKNASERIIDRYLKKLDERNVDEIVVSLKGLDIERRLNQAKRLILVIESGVWKTFDNKYDMRFDNRPDNQGGSQLHIKNKNTGIEWAYRSNGLRSERSRFTAPSTKDVREIVKDYFDLNKDVKIESHFVGFSSDGKQLLVEMVSTE